MTGLCIRCSRTGPLYRHHVTGRCTPDAAYLDPALVVDLCGRCHDAEHVLLRRLGMEWPGQADVLLHRVGRVEVLARRLAGVKRGLVLSPRSTAGLADLLGEVLQVTQEFRQLGEEGSG